jgi:S-formylglutathione hydrolase FrmB
MVQEVVGYIDSHYRTIPDAGSRGISGHSMGGYGALNLAMLHPDIFGAVYSISPGLFNENGLAESQMYGDIAVRNFLNGQQTVLAKPKDEQPKAVFSSVDSFTVAYGMAFAPNPNNSPFYMDFPYSDVNGELVRDEEIWKRWESGFGGIRDEIVQYKDNFLKLKGIVVDYAIQDELRWIPRGCIYFDEQLTAAGIPHELTAFEGNHNNKVAERISKFMLPFFSKLLAGE